MSLTEQSVAADQFSVSRNRLILVVYTLAIFVSALLLFSVQPLFTKMVLPRLGGSPAGWQAGVAVFQSPLVGGHGYADDPIKLRQRVTAVAVHPALPVGCVM